MTTLTRPAPRCAAPDVDPDWWHPGPGDAETVARAVALCRQCPLLTQCLAYALARPGLRGVWGGTSARRRRRLRRQMRGTR